MCHRFIPTFHKIKELMHAAIFLIPALTITSPQRHSGVYATTTATVAKTSHKNWICSASNLNTKPSASKFSKRKRKLLSFVPSSRKRLIRHFHVVLVQRRQINVKKKVIHVQSCCFACLKRILLYCRSRCRRRRCCVNSLLCDLLRMMLTMNNFTFNQQHYLQIHGTAMGTKMTLSFTDLFLGMFELNALTNR